MQPDIAVVIVGYNRPYALQRLFQSIANADYTDWLNISLIISIDFSGNNQCEVLAQNFEWKYGTKKVIAHTENLGLKNHIIQCGSFTDEYDAIILLEDDLFVAPGFYSFSRQAYTFYKDDERIAGIGLYSYPYNEFAYCPFEPIQDSYDNYFLQVPCSWGQMWTKNQWRSFIKYANATQRDETDIFLPEAALSWDASSSWKRSFFKYMVEAGKYFVYPRISLTTNFGDMGQHYDAPVLVWQASLLVGNKRFTFSSLQDSLSIYDPFFELDGVAHKRITDTDIDISYDLNGIKPLHKIKTKYLVSSKECKNAQKKYASSFYPFENNVLFNIEPVHDEREYFSLDVTSNFSDETIFNRINKDFSKCRKE